MSDEFKRVFGDIDAVARAMGIDPTPIIVCKGCKTKNRTHIGRKDPRCGKCGLPLEKR